MLALVQKTMTTNEARTAVDQINRHASEIGRLLLDLKERDGWRALGYDTWTACLRQEFVQSRQWLYVLMKAAPVQERMAEQGYRLSVETASTLAGFPDHLQENIVRATEKRYGAITTSRLQRVGTVLTQAVETGHVETSPGESSAIDQALALEDDEARKRQSDYINDGAGAVSFHVTLFPGNIEESLRRLQAAPNYEFVRNLVKMTLQ